MEVEVALVLQRDLSLEPATSFTVIMRLALSRASYHAAQTIPSHLRLNGASQTSFFALSFSVVYEKLVAVVIKLRSSEACEV